MAEHENTRLIPLTQGKFAIVDADDYEWLMQWTWCAQAIPRGFRAVRSGPRGKNIENRQVFKMHRVIMDAPHGVFVDHINHNPLDNRRENLRLCTPQENSRNRRAAIGSASQYIGVYWSRRYRKWEARFRVDGVHKWLGRYKSETEAAMAYDVMARQYYGEFANLNFT